MKFKNILYALSLVTLSACGDFLEPKSQSEYVPKNANSLQEMLIGVAYPQQKTGHNFLGYLEIFNDDLQQQVLEDYAFGSNNQVTGEALGNMFSWQSDMFTVMAQLGYTAPNVWKGTYEYILGANAALDYIGDVSGTEDEKNYIIAQALGLRAFYYYILVNYYGAPYNYNKAALGVPLKLDSGMREESEILMTRNTVEEVYTQIVKDLNEAERLFLTLPIDKQYQPNYMVSLPMVELLKSRIYLYMENWPEAKKYAGKVINDWNFSLLNLNTIALPDPTVDEPYYEFTSYQSPEVIWLYGNIQEFAAQYNTYLTSTTSTSLATRKAFTASESLLSSFKEGDLRKELYIVREILINSKNASLNTFYDTYLPYGKYKTNNSSPTTGGDYFALSFRLSEAYLNFAEAAALDNAEGEAISAMNTLLEKRYTPETYTTISGLTGEALVNMIRAERRKELCYEGQRWFDLRRYGMPSFTHTWNEVTYTLTEKDRSYTMPLSQQIMDKNKKLEQNPLAPRRTN